MFLGYVKEAGSTGAFLDYLHSIWFSPYARTKQARGVKDSSGFEHVFMHERKTNAQIGGLHSWVRMFWLEKQGVLDYAGYAKKQDVS